MPKSNTNASAQQRTEPLVVSKDEGYRARQLEEAAYRPREDRRLDFTMVDRAMVQRNLGVYAD